jgi:hypothetical protein
MSRLALLTLLSIAPVLPASAQDNVPPRRAHHSLVYDEAGKRVLLTGGSTPVDGGRTFTFFNDLWSFDGRSWTSLGESGQKLSGAHLAWDSRRNHVLSFGGYANGQSLGDLRVLAGASWNVLGQHPVYRASEPGFVHDVRRDRFVTFGGSQGPRSALGDTREWSDAGWNKVTIAGPPARQAHVMVFDAKRNRTVAFGGIGIGQPPMLSDTWEFDGTTWTQTQATGPSPRASAGAAYDSRRGVGVIFGGAGADGFFGDTWSWDGTTCESSRTPVPNHARWAISSTTRPVTASCCSAGAKDGPTEISTTPGNGMGHHGSGLCDTSPDA